MKAKSRSQPYAKRELSFNQGGFKPGHSTLNQEAANCLRTLRIDSCLTFNLCPDNRDIANGSASDPFLLAAKAVAFLGLDRARANPGRVRTMIRLGQGKASELPASSHLR